MFSSSVFTIISESTHINATVIWGMSIMHASYPWITESIPWEDSGEREVFLTLVVHLFNIQVIPFMSKLEEKIDPDKVA